MSIWLEVCILHFFLFSPIFCLIDLPKCNNIFLSQNTGSTFPKAKPKQSLLTIIRLAVIRYLFLPLYAKWWVAQTSSKIFAFLLSLYVLQMMNWAIYSYNVNRSQNKEANDSDTCNAIYQNEKQHVDGDFISITELMMPMSLSLLLSLIHSQIVATSSGNLSATEKHKTGPIHQHRKKRERKKRKKSMRPRASLTTATDSYKPQTKIHIDQIDGMKEPLVQINQRINSQKLNADNDQGCSASDSNCSPPQLRKRNVNWHSPIKCKFGATAVVAPSETVLSQIPLSNENPNHSNDDEDEVVERNENEHENRILVAADDDGFESLNGKSSSGEEMTAINNSNRSTQAIESNEEIEATARCNEHMNSAYINGSINVENVLISNNSDNDNVHKISGTSNVSENLSRLENVSKCC